jgi:hypothetical protein
MPGQIKLKELPEQDAPDYFRLLVRNCIETYKKIPNDALCLDYNRVSGKLRAMVLDDAEYKQETRNIYAKQQLEELCKIEKLEKLAFSHDEEDDEDEDEDEDGYDPRERGRKKKKDSVDKDMLNIRRGIAQMKRDLISSLNENNNTSERDATNLLFVGMAREEIEKSAKNELYGGDADDALGELTNSIEEAPEGSSGKLRTRGQDRPLEDEDSFDMPSDGEIIER